jgi:myo-inositol-1(or 4)-monophosphatase
MKKTLNAATGLEAAVAAALAVSEPLRAALNDPKKINEEIQHDIKLALDVETQDKIEKLLAAQFPDAAFFGEEGTSGSPDAEFRWVVDPIDGTVNFAYGIPHACISIALQQRAPAGQGVTRDGYKTIAGVVHDPFCHETWTGILGGLALLNGKTTLVSKRSEIGQAIVSMGFAKSSKTTNMMLPILNDLVYRVRKIRIMGSAALSLVYVASGRFDAYLEGGVRLWDIAAGGLIIECAGGEFFHQEIDQDHTYRLIANNGLLRSRLIPGA